MPLERLGEICSDTIINHWKTSDFWKQKVKRIYKMQDQIPNKLTIFGGLMIKIVKGKGQVKGKRIKVKVERNLGLILMKF